MNLKELREKLMTALKAARDIAAEAEKGNRDFTADERQKMAGFLEEAKGLKEQIKQVEGDEAMRKQIAELGQGLDLAPQAASAVAGGPAGRGKSIGERFASAEVFQSWMKRVAPNGEIPAGLKGFSSPPVEMKALLKELVTGSADTSAGAFVRPDYTGIVEMLGRRALTLLDLIPRGTTTSDTVHFVRQTRQANAAAPTPEANVTEYTGATGEVSGEKPEAGIAFEPVTETVKTIAVWIPATKRALSDAGQIRSLIDQELREDLREELEDQVFDGDGVGENFRGIANTSGHLVQAWDTDILTTTRKAKTYLMTTGRVRPTGWVMNPADWETIELLKDLQDRFYGGGPFSPTDSTLWGVPVAESECVHEGTAWLADWRRCRIWDREQATISVSDSHNDFFIRNMVAILAEMRAAFGVIRPSAFCEVDLTAGS